MPRGTQNIVGMVMVNDDSHNPGAVDPADCVVVLGVAVRG